MRFLTVVILLSILAFGAGAQPPAQLSDYVPPDILLYAELNIDDATVGGIDSLLANVTDRVGIEDVPTIGGVLQAFGVREWLGGKAALVVFPSASLEPALVSAALLVEIRDRAMIEAALVDQDAMVLPAQGEWSYYVVRGMSVSVTDGLMIASSGLGGLSLNWRPENSLTVYPPYTDAMAALPAADYAARVYLDPRSLVIAAAATSPDAFDTSAVNLPVLMDSLGVLGAGIIQLDDRSYALDVAHLHGDRHLFGAIYAPAPESVAAAPIDTDFLSVLPDDVYFAVQISRPWPQFRALLDAIAIGGTALRTRAFVNAAAVEDATGIDPIRSPLGQIPASFSTAAVLNIIEGTFDMNDAELSDAFNGQAVLASRVKTNEISYLLAVESAGLDVGRRIVRGAASLLPLVNLPDAESGDEAITFGTHEVLGVVRLLATEDALYLGSDALILADKQTFVAVPRLNEHETFVHDRALFLPDATHLAYLHLTPIRNATSELRATQTSVESNLYVILDLFDSFWVSARVEATRSVARFAFTLTP
jgi:hypothetical protein